MRREGGMSGWGEREVYRDKERGRHARMKREGGMSG